MIDQLRMTLMLSMSLMKNTLLYRNRKIKTKSKTCLDLKYIFASVTLVYVAALCFGKRKKKSNLRERCSLKGGVSHDFLEHFTFRDVLEREKVLDILVFIDKNCLTAITPLLSVILYWGCNVFVGNSSIQNAFMWTYFQVLLQNRHFADNSTFDETDKVYKIWPVFVHFNAAFTDAFCDEAKESFENVTKLKRSSSTRRHTSQAVVRRCYIKKMFLKTSQENRMAVLEPLF